MPGDAVGHSTQSRTLIAGLSQRRVGPARQFGLSPPVKHFDAGLSSTTHIGEQQTKWRCLDVRRSLCLLSSAISFSRRERLCQGICLPESISNDIESPYVLVHNRPLPSPDGGSFPLTWTTHLTQTQFCWRWCISRPSISNHIICQLMLSYSNKLGF
jgi:hypothetical protein